MTLKSNDSIWTGSNLWMQHTIKSMEVLHYTLQVHTTIIPTTIDCLPAQLEVLVMITIPLFYKHVLSMSASLGLLRTTLKSHACFSSPSLAAMITILYWKCLFTCDNGISCMLISSTLRISGKTLWIEPVCPVRVCVYVYVCVSTVLTSGLKGGSSMLASSRLKLMFLKMGCCLTSTAPRPWHPSRCLGSLDRSCHAAGG